MIKMVMSIKMEMVTEIITEMETVTGMEIDDKLTSPVSCTAIENESHNNII